MNILAIVTLTLKIKLKDYFASVSNLKTIKDCLEESEFATPT